MLSQRRGGGALKPRSAAASVVEASSEGKALAATTARAVKERPPTAVLVLLFSAFLNLLGFTMTGPITPALAMHFGLEQGPRIATLTSAYPCGMLVGLVVWPYLSDKSGVGRKRIIVGSLAGAGFGLALQSLALGLNWPLWSFLGLRVLTGAAAGSSPVTKAFLADLARPDQLAGWLAYREAAATLAFIVGPLLGGMLFFTSTSLAAVVGFTSVGSLAAAAFVAALCERTPKPRPSTTPMKAADSFGDAASCPLGARMGFAVTTIILISALENAGASCWDAFGAVLLQKRFALDSRSIGMLFTTFAGISLAVSAFAFTKVREATGIVATNVIGLSFIALGLAGVGLSQTSLAAFAGATALYQIGKPLYAPTLPTLLLRCVPPHRRGLAMGADAFVNTLARTVSPVLLGGLMQRRGSSAAFAAAAGLVTTAAAISTGRGLQVAAANRRLAADSAEKKR